MTDTDVDTLLSFFDGGRAGGSFDEGIGFALEDLFLLGDCSLLLPRGLLGLPCGFPGLESVLVGSFGGAISYSSALGLRNSIVESSYGRRQAGHSPFIFVLTL